VFAAYVSGVLHVGSRGGPLPDIHFDDLNWEKRYYSGTEAYAEAKLAVARPVLNLSKRLEGTGVSAFSIHPGWVRFGFRRGLEP
jgi:NAD(P)-dependent dehydrogenase (short-subunit alcohol dehydrogenase family)